MAIVNFSVPDDVKAAFDAAFAGRNKSAVIAQLMSRAVEESARSARRAKLYDELTAGRSRRPLATRSKISEARRRGRG